MITFSLVTVTYNAENVFPSTAESVLAQHYPHVEHIIIDGDSTDGTVRLAQEYKLCSDEQANGHAIHIVSEPDKGLYDAMNKGLGMATGDYVCFLNAGDRFPDKETLQRIAQTAEESEDGEMPAVLYGDTDIIDGQGTFVRHRRLAPPDRLTWRSFRRGMLVCHQAFHARTDIARAIPYDLKYRFSADVDWCIRVMKTAERQKQTIRRVPGVVADYLQEGMTTQNHQESLRERFQVMRKHYGIVTTTVMHLWFFLRSIRRR